MDKKAKIKKIYMFLLAIIVALLFITYTLNKFVDEDMGHDIEDMLGQEYAGGASLTVRDNYLLRSAINIYIQTIHSGDLDGAYNYLLPQYREHVAKEDYMLMINDVGTENFEIQDMSISRHTQNLFSFDVVIKNDLKLKLLLILDDENYYIVPEAFLDYKTIEQEITKKGVTYHLQGYQVDLERCVFDMTITNTNNEEVEIYEVKMTDTTGGIHNAINENITIPANETQKVSFVVETSVDFPAILDITRRDNNTIRVYTFEF